LAVQKIQEKKELAEKQDGKKLLKMRNTKRSSRIKEFISRKSRYKGVNY
jgi:hypothetical protein